MLVLGEAKIAERLNLHVRDEFIEQTWIQPRIIFPCLLLLHGRAAEKNTNP